ncbi:MAG: SDH family Clp fold serine proteinase, partial [Terriglobia bacterium]
YELYQERFLDICEAVKNPRKDLFLILVTNGGSPDVAYRIARCLQRKYKKLILCVSGPCKSAGTLVATGVDELIICDRGELGPLDIQVAKSDEFWEMSSGLVMPQALDALSIKTASLLGRLAVSIKEGSDWQVTGKTALEISARVVEGVFSPIYGQIDPAKLGESARAMLIMKHYGLLLSGGRENIHDEALEKLSAGYPSHNFVIDREEAGTLFRSVRKPKLSEEKLLELLNGRAREVALKNEQTEIRILSSVLMKAKEVPSNDQKPSGIQPGVGQDSDGDQPGNRPPVQDPGNGSGTSQEGEVIKTTVSGRI